MSYINQETTIESGLVTAINVITSPLGATVNNVDITLVNGQTYKQVNPIRITFQQNIIGNFTNFNAIGNTLSAKVALDIGIIIIWLLLD